MFLFFLLLDYELIVTEKSLGKQALSLVDYSD